MMILFFYLLNDVSNHNLLLCIASFENCINNLFYNTLCNYFPDITNSPVDMSVSKNILYDLHNAAEWPVPSYQYGQVSTAYCTLR